MIDELSTTYDHLRRGTVVTLFVSDESMLHLDRDALRLYLNGLFAGMVGAALEWQEERKAADVVTKIGTDALRVPDESSEQ